MSAISTERPGILGLEQHGSHSVIMTIDRSNLEKNAAKLVRLWLNKQQELQDQNEEPTIILERPESNAPNQIKITSINQQMNAEMLLKTLQTIMQKP